MALLHCINIHNQGMSRQNVSRSKESREMIKAILITALAVLFWVAPAFLLADILFRCNAYRWDRNRLLPAALCFVLALCWPVALLLVWHIGKDDEETTWHWSAYEHAVNWFQDTSSEIRTWRKMSLADTENLEKAETRLEMGYPGGDRIEKLNFRTLTAIEDRSQHLSLGSCSPFDKPRERRNDIMMVPLLYASVASDQSSLPRPPATPPPFTLPPPTSPITPILLTPSPPTSLTSPFSVRSNA